MIYPVDRLIENQKLVTVRETDTVRFALRQMIQNDFSQLPVIDTQGNLAGVISEQTIIRNFYHLGSKVNILDSKASDFCQRSQTLPRGSDVLEALVLLRHSASITIVDMHRPVGIVTNADLIEFFRDYSEALVLIEDVETTLRQFMVTTLPTDEEREAALANALSHREREDDSKKVTFDRMTLGDYIGVITGKHNWTRFEPLFGSKVLFQQHMHQVRDIRNQVVHFRGRLDLVQYDALKRAHNWLNGIHGRTTLDSEPVTTMQTPSQEDMVIDEQDEQAQNSGRYDRLEDAFRTWADQYTEYQKVLVTFEVIEQVMGDKLSQAAREHSTWWANEVTDGRQSLAWLRPGWEVTSTNLPEGEIFVVRRDKARYIPFWAEIMERLRERRPELTNQQLAGRESWKRFESSESGIYFGWNFASRGQFVTYLVLDSGEEGRDKERYEKLKLERERIDAQFDDPPEWDSSPRSRYFFISLERPGRISDSQDELDELQDWGVETMIDFLDAFQPFINEL